jgi:hypothetical protein
MTRPAAIRKPVWYDVRGTHTPFSTASSGIQLYSAFFEDVAVNNAQSVTNMEEIIRSFTLTLWIVLVGRWRCQNFIILSSGGTFRRFCRKGQLRSEQNTTSMNGNLVLSSFLPGGGDLYARGGTNAP